LRAQRSASLQIQPQDVPYAKLLAEKTEVANELTHPNEDENVLTHSERVSAKVAATETFSALFSQ